MFLSFPSLSFIKYVTYSLLFTEKEAFSFYGSLNYAENIEDEWFLVYILMELTKQVKDLVVR